MALTARRAGGGRLGLGRAARLGWSPAPCGSRPRTPANGSGWRGKASSTPKGAPRGGARGWRTSTTWGPSSAAPRTLARVGWKSTAAPAPHATGAAPCRSSRREAGDEQWYSLPLNRVECEISGILAGRTAAEWEELLIKADIGCVRADEALEGEFYADHPYAKANALSVEVEHPYVGKYLRYGGLVEFSLTPGLYRPSAQIAQ